jgi:hypothetical protein
MEKQIPSDTTYTGESSTFKMSKGLLHGRISNFRLRLR